MIKLYYTLNRRKWNKDLLQLIILIFELFFSTEWEYGNFFVARKTTTQVAEKTMTTTVTTATATATANKKTKTKTPSP